MALSSRISANSALVAPWRCPRSTWAWTTHRRTDSFPTPSRRATAWHAAVSVGYSCTWSSTNRTQRSLTFGSIIFGMTCILPTQKDAARNIGRFRRLRPGRGIHAPDLVQNLGATLKSVIFGDADPNPSTAQATVARMLIEAAQRLSPDLERIYLAAVGITRTEPQLGERLAAVGRELSLSARTLYRRLQAAEHAIAAHLERLTLDNDDDNPFAIRGWYVESLESDAYLAEPRPVFVGEREIRATHDGLRVICESFSIPRYASAENDPDPEVSGGVGCEEITLSRFSRSTWLISLRLDTALDTGDSHRIGVSIRMPSRASIRPFNVTVPVRHINSFVARVHAEPGQLARAWSIGGVPPISMDELGRSSAALPIDVPLECRWSVVRRGLAYGIGWEWADSHRPSPAA
ncbi:MAG: hypothetical protein V9F04_08355 [Dermatophilaceae bacterium]